MPAESNRLSVSKQSEKLFRRGFKSWCDNTSVGIRTKMGIRSYDPLSAYDLAERLNVTIMELEEVELLPPETLTYLSSKEHAEWSAVTIEVEGKYYIVINPTHSIARKSSDIMHELSHIICDHDTGKIFTTADYAFRDYNELQETEANWLAATLLLPRDSVFHISGSSHELEDELSRYGVSKSLYNWRLNKTGVRLQRIRMAR